MNLLLIRHAEQQTAPFGFDPDLTDVGRRQAEHLARHLAPEPIDAVWVSPLARARQTAAPIAARHRLEPVLHPGLRELGGDDLRDARLDDRTATSVLRRGWEALRGGATDADGLDVHGFRERVRTALDEIVAAHPGSTVAVICHGGVINAYLATVLGLSRAMWFEPAHASIQRLRASSTGLRTVEALNERACDECSVTRAGEAGARVS